MKSLLLLFCINLVLLLNASAQNCPYETSVPDEIYRGRYIEAGMTYGNPYTMFNRRKDNWSLSDDTTKLIKYIINGVAEDGKTNNEYSPTVRSLVCWAIAQLTPNE